MSRLVIESVPISPDSQPFGTAFLPEVAMGVDLSARDYVEEEYLLHSTANVWRRTEDGAREAVSTAIPFSTRVLIRRPTSSDSSGLTVVEPLHPDLDSALVWNDVHPWILREGHSWMGVTVFSTVTALLRDHIDPRRYETIDIPRDGMQYDVMAAALQAATSGEFGSIAGGPVILAGMSATGSFCRVVLQDGFHDDWRRQNDQRLVDGYIIGISSGGAGAAGYPPLSQHDAQVADDDPRRTIDARDAIVFEILSETEAETHRRVIRPDSDDSGSAYRLYEVAATAHIEARASVLTNRQQYERRDGRSPTFSANEQPSDARFDLYLRGAFEAMSRWLLAGDLPPRAERFERLPGTEDLLRDARGNVNGGIRTPWITVPTGVYAPHSTASSESEPPPEWMPFGQPDMLAQLVGSMRPFSISELRERYGSRAGYLDAFAEAVRGEVDRGLLLPDDGEELMRSAPQRWRG